MNCSLKKDSLKCCFKEYFLNTMKVITVSELGVGELGVAEQFLSRCTSVSI